MNLYHVNAEIKYLYHLQVVKFTDMMQFQLKNASCYIQMIFVACTDFYKYAQPFFMNMHLQFL